MCSPTGKQPRFADCAEALDSVEQSQINQKRMDRHDAAVIRSFEMFQSFQRHTAFGRGRLETRRPNRAYPSFVSAPPANRWSAGHIEGDSNRGRRPAASRAASGNDSVRHCGAGGRRIGARPVVRLFRGARNPVYRTGGSNLVGANRLIRGGFSRRLLLGSCGAARGIRTPDPLITNKRRQDDTPRQEMRGPDKNPCASAAHASYTLT